MMPATDGARLSRRLSAFRLNTISFDFRADVPGDFHLKDVGKFRFSSGGARRQRYVIAHDAAISPPRSAQMRENRRFHSSATGRDEEGQYASREPLSGALAI